VRPTRLVEWVLVLAGLAVLAINLWITPRVFYPYLNVGRWGLFALAGLLGLAAQTSRAGAIKIPWGGVLTTVFVAVAFSSTVWSLAPSYTMARAISIALLVVGVYLFGAGGSALAGGGLLISSMIWINWAILLVSILMLPLPRSWDSGLYRGPFGNPNGLAGALVLTLPFIVGKAFASQNGTARFRSWWPRVVLRVASFATVALILLSRSRTVIVTMLVVLMLFAVATVRRKVEVVVVGSFLIGLTLIVVPAQAARPAIKHFVYKGYEGDVFFSRRESLEATWAMARERPWFGHGFGVAGDTMPGQAWGGGFTTPIGFGREKTNSYLGLVEEVGVVGTLPLLLGLGYGVYRAGRRIRSIGWSDPIGMALLACVLSGLVHVNGEAWLTSAGSLEAFWFWWTAGVLFSPSFWRHPRPRLQRTR
jgi:O-antigen ligase